MTDPVDRARYRAEILARGNPSRHVCAAGCGQPVSRWHTDAAGQRWHPECRPTGSPAATTPGGPL